MHAANDAQIRHTAVAEFLFHERTRDDADHLTLLRQRSISHSAHETDIAAAIDHSESAARQECAKLMSRHTMCGITAKTGTTIDTYSAQTTHALMMNAFRASCKGLHSPRLPR